MKKIKEFFENLTSGNSSSKNFSNGHIVESSNIEPLNSEQACFPFAEDETDFKYNLEKIKTELRCMMARAETVDAMKIFIEEFKLKDSDNEDLFLKLGKYGQNFIECMAEYRYPVQDIAGIFEYAGNLGITLKTKETVKLMNPNDEDKISISLTKAIITAPSRRLSWDRNQQHSIRNFL